MMTIGARHGDWLRRVRAEMRGPREETAPVVVRFAAAEKSLKLRPAIKVPPLETLPPAASLVPANLDALMSTLHYAR